MQEGRPGDWSPDSRRIVFDLTIDGNTDIYVADVDGAPPVRLTTEPSMDGAPSWSPDGQWIYFFSDRSGFGQIWKVPASGGPATRVTSGFGFEPRPSPDGQFIYFLTCFPWTPCQLKRIPVAGGIETVILDRAVAFSWSVTPSGIYFLTRETSGEWLDVYDPGTSKRSRLGKLPFRPATPGFCPFMAVSQDGRFLIANHIDRFDSNLGLLEISR
jgi:dipeptidyl aminopeptidase/acylaminoacyl peptidase